jgi:hypothetical protein
MIRFNRTTRRRLSRFARGGWGIVDQPPGAFAGFRNCRFFTGEDDIAVSWRPRLTLIAAVNPVEWAPRLIGRVIYLTGRCNYGEAFVIVTVIHTSILTRSVPDARSEE